MSKIVIFRHSSQQSISPSNVLQICNIGRVTDNHIALSGEFQSLKQAQERWDMVLKRRKIAKILTPKALLRWANLVKGYRHRTSDTGNKIGVLRKDTVQWF